MPYSKTTELALKAKKVYSSIDSNWYCYYHALSGDELKEQILTIAYKPSDDLWSFSFKDLSSIYKEKDIQGLIEFIKTQYKVQENEVFECLNCIKDFLNDAKIEYTNKPYFV
jgi:hypothetical protein